MVLAGKSVLNFIDRCLSCTFSCLPLEWLIQWSFCSYLSDEETEARPADWTQPHGPLSRPGSSSTGSKALAFGAEPCVLCRMLVLVFPVVKLGFGVEQTALKKPDGSPLPQGSLCSLITKFTADCIKTTKCPRNCPEALGLLEVSCC